MCGIFGFAGDRTTASGLDLGPVQAALEHRGPDDRGRLVEAGPGDAAVALVHTRLAILDLSPAGHQPMVSASGRHVLVFNGEVFNFAEVKRDLEAEGVPIRSTGDSEVVLEAIVHWGPATAVKRFRGMFALAVWDRTDGSLLLVRDRLGIKPLYLLETARGLAFASEVRALLATGLSRRRLSREGLGSYLAFGSVSEPHTMIEGIRSLPPGHMLTWRDGTSVVTRYWSLPESPARRLTYPEAVETLRPVLTEAIRLRLVSDVPLGIFLSGGIDSSALLALASVDRPHSFTVTFDETRYSEAAFAAEVASHYGSEHHEVRISPASAASSFETALAAQDQPSADGINTYIVAKAAREAGLTVALSGLGGDELFAGYPSFRSFGRLLAAGRAGRILPSGVERSMLGSRFNQARKLGAVLGGGGAVPATYAALRAMFTERQIQALLGPGLRGHPVEASGFVEGAAAGDPVNALSRLELAHYIPSTLLRDTDSMSMAHALEVRVPYLDHEVVELLLSLPGALKLRPGRKKPLLVDVAPDLPQAASRRPKMGFVLPFDDWFRGPLFERVGALLDGPTGGPLDPENVRRQWRSFLRGERFTSSSRIVCLTSLVAWCQRHRVEVPETQKVRPRAVIEATSARRAAPPGILLLLPGAFSAPGGIEMYNRSLIRAFSELAEETGARCDVLVLNDRAGGADPRYLGEGALAPELFAGDRPRFVAQALARAARHQPGLIVFGHVNFLRLAPALAAAVPAARTWVVTYGVDVWRRLGLGTRLTLRGISRILSISDFTRRELERVNGIRTSSVHLLPCPLDPVWQAEFERPEGEDAPEGPASLLTVARLDATERYKGIDSVLEALREVATRVPGVRYQILGDGDDRGRLERLAGDLGVADRVTFAGRVTAASLAAAYSGCKLFVMPSSKEGFGIVFLEAALFGKPSIGGRHGGTPEVIADGATGLLVERTDVSGIAQAITRLLTAPGLREEMGRRARERVLSRFTYGHFRTNLFDLAEVDLLRRRSV